MWGSRRTRLSCSNQYDEECIRSPGKKSVRLYIGLTPGVSEPSDAEKLITRRLKEALALVDIRLLDHIIVPDGETVSFAERGLI